jgi:hypothetical protein
MKYIKEFLQSTIFKRFLWNTLSGFLTLVAVYVGNINWIYAPIVFALCNGLSKEINERYGNIK